MHGYIHTTHCQWVVYVRMFCVCVHAYVCMCVCMCAGVKGEYGVRVRGAVIRLCLEIVRVKIFGSFHKTIILTTGFVNPHYWLHTYIHTNIHTYIHTYIHTCIHTYIHTHTHAHIRTHTHIRMHTYAKHTHIHDPLTVRGMYVTMHI